MKFLQLVERIGEKSPMQRKKIASHLAERPPAFFVEADSFIEHYTHFLVGRGLSIDYAIDAYLKMCSSMVRCQLEFMRTGRYPVQSSIQANDTVYSSEREMLSYMIGLGLSQFLWSTHYDIYTFFGRAIDERSPSISSYLEIGPGHGLLLERAVGSIPNLSKAIAIDISPTSLKLTQSLVAQSSRHAERIDFILGDILDIDLGQDFDFISMGEVLEHVNQPQLLLKRLQTMLTPIGVGFISTCANCPAVDHVYQFNTVQQIRDLLVSSGLTIISDLPLPVESMTVSEAEGRKITINYCAIVR